MSKSASSKPAGKAPVDINKWNQLAQKRADEYKEGKAEGSRFFPDDGDYLFVLKGVHRDIFPAEDDRPSRPYFCPIWSLPKHDSNPEEYHGKEFRGEIFDFSVKKEGFCPTKQFLADTIGKAAITDDPIQDVNTLEQLTGCFMEVKCKSSTGTSKGKDGKTKTYENHRVYVKKVLDSADDVAQEEELPSESDEAENDNIPASEFSDGEEATEEAAEEKPANTEGDQFIPSVGDKGKITIGGKLTEGTFDSVDEINKWASFTYSKGKGKTATIRSAFVDLRWDADNEVFVDA